MTHRVDSRAIEQVVEVLIDEGLGGMSRAFEILMDEAMKVERSRFLLQQNAQAYVPKVSMRREVAQGLRNVFDAPDRAEADRQLGLFVERYREKAPRLAAWAEENIPEGLTVFMRPPYHRTLTRTTNGQENLNKEIKRRTRVATIFPNDASLLRLVTAVVAEISEEWEAGGVCLNMESV